MVKPLEVPRPWIGGGDTYRGGDGPLATNAGNRMRNPLYRAFVEAGVEAGYGATADRMVELASKQPGFLGIESTRDEAGFGITVSYWESEAAIAAWRRGRSPLCSRPIASNMPVSSAWVWASRMRR